MIPEKYSFLNNIGTLPKLVSTALQYLGVKEIPGKQSNAIIINMAKQLGISDIYTNDDEPWCALFMSFLCFITGKQLPGKQYDLIRAVSFLKWGQPVLMSDIRLGDIIVIKRKGGYHVCIAIAVSEKTVHVIGGNQSNTVCFAEINKDTIEGVRRLYQTQMPDSAKVYSINSDGKLLQSAA